MCGGVARNPGVKGKRGSEFLIDIGNRNVNAKWLDHSRSETLYKWLNNKWQIGYMDYSANTYTEGHNPEVEFKVPEGKRIKVIYLEKNGNTIFNIVTCQANEIESKVHPRFPIVE